MADSKNIGISLASIAIAVIAIIIAAIPSGPDMAPVEVENKYTPQTKEIWLFTQVDETIDEEKYLIPPDLFSLDSIVVNKGDNVKIHFYNLEPEEKQEHHTFTIDDPAYMVHAVINSEENTIIEFTVSEAGVFDYLCTFHQPTMRGQLLVLDP